MSSIHTCDLFDTLSHEYYHLTASEKKVADYVVANRTTAQHLSITEMAEACEVAEATISRFCRRLGFDGYATFKLAVATSAAVRVAAHPLSGEVSPQDTVPDLARKLAGVAMEAVAETERLLCPELIRQAADLLLAAHTVLCMGQGGSMILAQEAAHLFSTAFPNYYAISDSHMQAIRTAQLTPQDVILYFSYSGSTIGLLEVEQIASQRGVPIILITRYPKSPGSAQARLVLQCGSTESPLQLGSIPARISQLYLMDVLFAELCRRDLDTCRRRRAQVAQALSGKHI